MDFFCICLCHIILSVSYSLVATYWERTDLLALLYVTFACACHLPIGCPESGVVLIILIPDLCLLSYFVIDVKT